MAGASSRVFLVALAVASFAIAPPALAAGSGGQAQASAPQTYALQGSASVSSASSAPRGGTWGNAELVPGTATLNGGGWAGVGGLSCTSPGDCAGSYQDAAQIFVVDETNGTWGAAQQISGTNLGSGYAVTATFEGNADFLPSVSARKTLRITR